MASTAVSAMPHNLHHIPLPAIPRIRPPRMMPGHISPNTAPQPSAKPPKDVPRDSVWVQGKWRRPQSNATKHVKEVVSRQVQKALRHEKHGLDIFAYFHIRTHQVVYSLTCIPQESRILPQLLFLGKQTKPASLRRDHWRPYYSIRFPSTPAGQRAGLTAYKRLREFAIRRQLSPDKESLRNTQVEVDNWYARLSPVDNYIKLLDKKARPPKIGRIMGLGARARKLMREQKACSVADASLVLKLAVEQINELTKEDLQDHTKDRLKYELGWRGRKRLTAIRKEEGVKKEQIEARAASFGKGQGRLKVGLDGKIANEISLEYGHKVNSDNTRSDILLHEREEVESLEAYSKRLDEIQAEPDPEKKAQLQQDLTQIEILWADMRDGTYAESWPESVSHDDMQPMAFNGRDQWSPHVAARDGTPEKETFYQRLTFWGDLHHEIQEAKYSLNKLTKSSEMWTKEGKEASIARIEMKWYIFDREEAEQHYEEVVSDVRKQLKAATERVKWLGTVKEGLPESVTELLTKLKAKNTEEVSMQLMRKQVKKRFVMSEYVVPDEAADFWGKEARRIREEEKKNAREAIIQARLERYEMRYEKPYTGDFDGDLYGDLLEEEQLEVVEELEEEPKSLPMKMWGRVKGLVGR